ncbi:MAG: hypothetical protein ABSH48_27165 [Verrucomicrobiota bacterium]|jgi:hypothetical protein
MKLPFCVIGLVVMALGAGLPAWASETGDTADKHVSQAIESKDINEVVSVLPQIEELWPQRPKEYFESVQQAADVLRLSTITQARSGITNLFLKMVEKQIPEPADQAVSCLEEKNDAILFFLNFSEVREDKTNLLALARYVGTIRGQIVPDFFPKTVYINPPGLMDATRAQAQQIIQQNQQNLAYNRWQQSLAAANTILTFHLLHNAAFISAGHPENSSFARDVEAAARLTADETQQLK